MSVRVKLSFYNFLLLLLVYSLVAAITPITNCFRIRATYEIIADIKLWNYQLRVIVHVLPKKLARARECVFEFF